MKGSARTCVVASLVLAGTVAWLQAAPTPRYREKKVKFTPGPTVWQVMWGSFPCKMIFTKDGHYQCHWSDQTTYVGKYHWDEKTSTLHVEEGTMREVYTPEDQMVRWSVRFDAEYKGKIIYDTTCNWGPFSMKRDP